MPVSAFISALAIITVKVERIAVTVSGGDDIIITAFIDSTVNDTPAPVTAISADRAVPPSVKVRPRPARSAVLGSRHHVL